MADVGFIAMIVAGLGVSWWRHLRRAPRRLTAGDVLDTDAEVALHVASHEARSRGQDLSSLHILYGLLQVDTVTEAIATSGGDASALEDRVLAALRAPIDTAHDDGEGVLRVAIAVASRGGRKTTCTDLWAYLGDSRAGALIDTALDRGAILFALFHGGRAPEVSTSDERDVFVVLRNDHYTTHTFVCEVLRDVFALPDAQAAEITQAAHTTGRAVIGRFSTAAARAKLREVRVRASAHAFPLWVGVEPA